MQSKWDFVGDFCPSRPHLIVYANYTNPRRSIENFLFLRSTQLHRNANIQKYRESQMLQRCYSESGTSNEDVFPSVNYESRSQLLKPKQSSPSLVLALPFFLVDAFAVFRGSSHWFALGMFSELYRYVTTVTSLAPLKLFARLLFLDREGSNCAKAPFSFYIDCNALSTFQRTATFNSTKHTEVINPLTLVGRHATQGRP